MESTHKNLRDSSSEPLNNENDLYHEHDENILYDDTQNFDYLQEIASKCYNNSNNWNIQVYYYYIIKIC